MKRIQYQIQESDGSWTTVKKGEVLTRLSRQFLRYEVDGVIGLKRPGTWRVKPSQAGEQR